MLIEDIFQIETKLVSYDEKHGYVIAAYVATRQFDKAAEEVLIRDAKRPKWDYKLKEDFAFCIRNYSLRNSLKEGLDLIESFKKKYNSKLLSVFWCSLPIEVVRGIRDGKHCSNLAYSQISEYGEEQFRGNPEFTGNIIKAIQYLVKYYPEDPFIDYGYYFLQDYEKALEMKPKSIIKDVLIYAQGYRYILELQLNNNEDTEQIDKNLNKNKNNLLKAIDKFENYLIAYQAEPLADDAIFWKSWCEIRLGNFNKAVDLLSKIISYGDKDRASEARDLLNTIIAKIDKKKIKKLLALENYWGFYSKQELIRNICANIENDDVYIDNISSLENSILSSYAYYQLALKKFKSYDFVNAEKYANIATNEYYSSNNLKTNELIDDVEEVKYENDALKTELETELEKIIRLTNLIKPITYSQLNNIDDYINISIDLRTKEGSRILSNFALTKGIEKFPNSNNIDYLLYLKIVTMKETNIDEVESSINQLLSKYPSSNYIDDALAETIYSYTQVFPNTAKSEEYFNQLNGVSDFLTYKGNAVDNASNWLAYYYCEECTTGFNTDDSKRGEICEKGKKLCTQIKSKFYYTRFSNKADRYLSQIVQYQNRKIR